MTNIPPNYLFFYFSLLAWILASTNLLLGGKRLLWSVVLVAVCGYLYFPIPGAPNSLKRNGSKIFGIGLSRTGTTTLATAMHDVGYVSTHAPLDFFDFVNGTFKYRPRVVDGYDFIGDIQASLVFEQLEQDYPLAKFIYTKRSPRAFALSAYKFFSLRKDFWESQDLVYENHLSSLPTGKFFKAMYGEHCLTYSIEEWEQAYVIYEARVKDYFRYRSNDRLLELDATAGEGWEKLSPFLGDNFLPKNGSLQPVDVFVSVIHQSFWSLENLFQWILYKCSRKTFIE